MESADILVSIKTEEISGKLTIHIPLPPMFHEVTMHINHRSSRPEVFCKKGVLKNFTKFTGKRPRPANLLKKRLWDRRFPVNFAKFLRTSDGCF